MNKAIKIMLIVIGLMLILYTLYVLNNLIFKSPFK